MEFFRSLTFLLPNNPKLLFSISLLFLLLHSSLTFLLPNFQSSPTSLLHHLLHAQFPPPPPSSSSLRHDLPLLLTFAAAFSLISFLSSLSTLLLTSYSSSSLRTFLFSAFRTCPRLLLTCLHVFSFSLGYLTLAASLTAPLLLHFNFNRLSLILTTLVVVTLISYLSVPLALSLPVAVVEENCYGLEAIGKAATLIGIGGKRVSGFVVNACFCGVLLGAIEIWRRVSGNVVWEIGAANLVFVGKIIVEIVYTVVYFGCKRERGEEIELFGGLQYGKLPTVMALSDVEEEEEDGGLL